MIEHAIFVAVTCLNNCMITVGYWLVRRRLTWVSDGSESWLMESNIAGVDGKEEDKRRVRAGWDTCTIGVFFCVRTGAKPAVNRKQALVRFLSSFFPIREYLFPIKSKCEQSKVLWKLSGHHDVISGFATWRGKLLAQYLSFSGNSFYPPPRGGAHLWKGRGCLSEFWK